MLCARVSSFKLTLEVWRVLEGRKSCSGRGNFQGASIPRYTHVKHEPIVKSDMNYYTAIIQIIYKYLTEANGLVVWSA